MSDAAIYYFNPTCELAVSNGSFSYMPPLLLQNLESDLSILPFIFGTEKDFVITENPPSHEFQTTLRKAGFNLPAFCRLTELESLPAGSFGTIIPWGWSPAVHFKLKNLKEKCSAEFRNSVVFNWNAEHQLLYERSTSLDFLYKILDKNPPNWFIGADMCGIKVESCNEIEILLKKYSELVLKAPVSSSGRGIQIIRNSKLNSSNRQWISGVLKQQKYLIAEPCLKRLLDLSFQFKIQDNSEVLYLGYSIFETNSNGQYKGTFIHPDLRFLLPEVDFTELKEKIEITADILQNALLESEYAKHYRGYLGVDALIFKHNHTWMIQPCIEVNCRINMGILSLKLENKIHQDVTGKFELCLVNSAEFKNNTAMNSEIKEIKYKDEKIYSGFLPLVEPDQNKKFGAYLSLGSAK